MTGGSRSAALYRRLTALYPQSFRHEYGADLVELFMRQVDDEGAARVWARALRDLAVTIPVQHLEAHMKRRSPHLVTLGFGIVAAVGALLAVTTGTGPAAAVFAVGALGAGLVSYWSWQAHRTVDAPARLWWKLLLAGPALAAVTVVGTVVPWPDAIDLGDNAYWLLVVAFGTSIVLAAAGLLLGIGTAVDRRGRSLSSTSS
jgi:hypothetical protein